MKKHHYGIGVAVLGLLVLMTGFWATRSPSATTENMGDTKSRIVKLDASADLPQSVLDRFTVEVTQEGDGDTAKAGDIVSVHYTGTLEDGTKFDSSLDRGEPISFPIGVGAVIRGWDLGIEGMKVGEKRTLTIPSELGYGARGAGAAIPPNATLIFTTELVGISLPPVPEADIGI